LYLPSKLNSKYIGFIVLFLLLLILPFENYVNNIFVFLSSKLYLVPQQYVNEIKELEKKNLVLSLGIKESENLQRENKKLKKALKFYEKRKIHLIGAEIISFDPSNWRRVVIINAGKNKGVAAGAYAVDEEGWLVGKISDVRADYSRLIFVNDPDFNAPVFVGETSFGLLKGGLGNSKIFYIENGEEIKIKDKVWLKIPSITLPVYVGGVKRVKQDKNSLFWNVEVELFSKNLPLHKIFIIK
jgi:rod shape-determining protein MreC